MPNIFQRLFLSGSALREIYKQQEILKLALMSYVHHKATIRSNGVTVRCFSVSQGGRSIYVSRIYNPSFSKETQIKFTLCYHIDGVGNHYTTNSDVDKFAEKAYNKMYNAWQKSRQHVK